MITDIRDLWQNVYDDNAQAFKFINVDGSGNIIKSTRKSINLSGSAGTGLDGQANRVFTVISANAIEISEVYLDGVLLVNTTNYTINNALKEVTIILNVWDTQVVNIVYYI
jgi:hypothetical protein